MPRDDRASTGVVRRGRSPNGDVRATIVVPATNVGSREAIRHIGDLVDPTHDSAEDTDKMEIALAEVFNNIVEHAFAGRSDGTMEITVDVSPPGLHFVIADDGAPMPAGRLPGGNTADTGREGHEQAEGGYGLHLIRQVARKLRYERIGNRNRLSFRIAIEQRT